MPYILSPKKDPEYTHQENYVWVQKATTTKPAAYVLEIWHGYDPDKYMTAAQKKKWKAFTFPKRSVSSVRKTVAAYKKKGYVVVTNEDIAKLFKEYVPRSYAAALKSKKINPKSQYRFEKDGSGWVAGAAPMNHIWDKPSVVSVYNQFLKSMTWGGKKPKNSPKSPASYFWGWNRPLDFSGSHNVIPMVYGSDTVMLHNYKTGKVAVVTDCEGDDDEAGEYVMSTVAFEWKMNPKLVAAMKTTTKAKPKPKAKASKPKAKPKTKYILGKKDRPTDLKKRKSPPYSAKQFPKGARKKGNNGKMWTIVTDKRGVKRWKA